MKENHKKITLVYLPIYIALSFISSSYTRPDSFAPSSFTPSGSGINRNTALSYSTGALSETTTGPSGNSITRPIQSGTAAFVVQINPGTYTLPNGNTVQAQGNYYEYSSQPVPGTNSYVWDLPGGSSITTNTQQYQNNQKFVDTIRGPQGNSYEAVLHYAWTSGNSPTYYANSVDFYSPNYSVSLYNTPGSSYPFSYDISGPNNESWAGTPNSSYSSGSFAIPNTPYTIDRSSHFYGYGSVEGFSSTYTLVP
jgi:hypothetical protein